MKDQMVFCTAAQFHQQKFIKRVQHWLTQIDKLDIDADLYCFIDGTVQQPENLKRINWINLGEPLGRLNIWCFPGCKRNYAKAFEYSVEKGYKKFCFIENDVELVNIDKIKKCLDSEKACSSIDGKYKWMESNFMVVNSVQDRKKIIERYKDTNSYYEQNILQVQWTKLIDFDFPLKSFRLDGNTTMQRIPGYDFYAQIFENLQFKVGRLPNR